MTMQSIEPTTVVQTDPFPSQQTDTSLQSRYYTETDLERVREQEKSKLYDRLQKQQDMLNTFKSTVDELKAEKDARATEAAEQRKAAEAAQRRAEEEKMSAQELITSREAELNQKLEAQRQEMDNRIAIWQKEQEFLNLKAYTVRRVAEERDNIIPDLVEYITGNSEAEVEAAISKAREKTESIVKGAQTLTAPVPPGVSPTGIPGIMSIPSGPRQYSRDDIANMSMSEYANYRKQQGMDRRGNGQGLFT